MFRQSFQCYGSKLLVVVPSPRDIGPALSAKLNMGAALLLFGPPADFFQRAINSFSFTAWPLAHEKRIDLGGLRTRSEVSAITRNASAVTAISASGFVAP